MKKIRIWNGSSTRRITYECFEEARTYRSRNKWLGNGEKGKSFNNYASICLS
jgi:hypothetical protein